MKKLLILILIMISHTSFSESDIEKERNLIKKERTDLAIGWRDNLGYELPQAGSYKLFSVRKSGDGKVLLPNGDLGSLHNLMDNKITLLSFIYSNCTDTNGCPLATSVFYKIQENLKKIKKYYQN